MTTGELTCPVCKQTHSSNPKCGLLVFVLAKCPICLEEKSPVMALPCGHTLCQDDFDHLVQTTEEVVEVSSTSGSSVGNSDSSSSDDETFDGDSQFSLEDSHHSSDWLGGSGYDDEGSCSRSWTVDGERSIELNSEEDENLTMMSDNTRSSITSHNTDRISTNDDSSSDSTNENIFHFDLPSPSQSFPRRAESGFQRERGAWILCRQKRGMKELWYSDFTSKRHLYTYPANSKLFSDGLGGLWIHTKNSLIHSNPQREMSVSSFPKKSKFVTDGRGGVYILSSKRSNQLNHTILYHVDLEKETTLFTYPFHSKLFGDDGNGGLWILCETQTEGIWNMWHANIHGETNEFQCPKNAKIATDHHGGMWILHPDTQRLHHIDKHGMRREHFQNYPATSRLISDGKGGLWIHQVQVNKWKVFHVTLWSEEDLYDCPKAAKLAGDGNGGLWILRKDPARNNNWSLWHANRLHYWKVHDGYHADSFLAC